MIIGTSLRVEITENNNNMPLGTDGNVDNVSLFDGDKDGEHFSLDAINPLPTNETMSRKKSIKKKEDEEEWWRMQFELFKKEDEETHWHEPKPEPEGEWCINGDSRDMMDYVQLLHSCHPTCRRHDTPCLQMKARDNMTHKDILC